MANQPKTAPARVAVSGQDVLLATKLHVPGLQPGFVPRPRLVEALSNGLARQLILVCAPAGFGKTAVLADWARRGRWPVAWLSLDTGDNDPARFWRHATAALGRARPGIAERVSPLLGPPTSASFEPLVTALVNELADQPGEDDLLLVLDDYHLVGSEPVHTSVAFLLGHLPPGLHLVLASRADPPLPLARLRGRGQLAELRASELRFTSEEAAALLREAAGSGLPDAVSAALAARTEGWAAGLQLAGLSLRGKEDVAGFVAAFSGSNRYVLDYLTDEVLAGQTEQVRGFLLETSLLERLSGDLCDAVTGRTGSQALPRSLHRPWPGSARLSGCWLPSPGLTWPSPSGCTAGSQRPSAPSPPAAPGGRRPASHYQRMALYELGQVQRAQGRLDAAVRTCQQALEITAPHGQPPLPAAGPAYVGLGEVAYERNELDSALRHVTEGIALCRQFVYTPPLAAGLVTLAWIRQATGDPAGALDAIGEAMRAAPIPAGLLNPVPGPAGAAAAGPGRPGRSRPLDDRPGPRRRRRAGLPAGA